MTHCLRCGLDEPARNNECFRDDRDWACARLPKRQTCDKVAEGTIILVAPLPRHEYVVGDRAYYSDQGQIIREVQPDHLDALIGGHKCTMVPKVIVVHSFPEGHRFVHCFGCGGFIEAPPYADPQVWLKDGKIIDFVFYHKPHAEDRVFTVPKPEPKNLDFEGKIEPATHILYSGGPDPTFSANLKLEKPPQPKSVVRNGPA